MKDYYSNLSEDQAQWFHNIRSSNMKKSWQEGKFNTEAFHNAAKQRGIDMHTAERELLIYQGIRRYWDNITPEEKAIRRAIAIENAKKGAAAVKGKPRPKEANEKMKKDIS